MPETVIVVATSIDLGFDGGVFGYSHFFADCLETPIGDEPSIPECGGNCPRDR